MCEMSLSRVAGTNKGSVDFVYCNIHIRVRFLMNRRPRAGISFCWMLFEECCLSVEDHFAIQRSDCITCFYGRCKFLITKSVVQEKPVFLFSRTVFGSLFCRAANEISVNTLNLG